MCVRVSVYITENVAMISGGAEINWNNGKNKKKKKEKKKRQVRENKMGLMIGIPHSKYYIYVYFSIAILCNVIRYRES